MTAKIQLNTSGLLIAMALVLLALMGGILYASHQIMTELEQVYVSESRTNHEDMAKQFLIQMTQNRALTFEQTMRQADIAGRILADQAAMILDQYQLYGSIPLPEEQVALVPAPTNNLLYGATKTLMVVYWEGGQPDDAISDHLNALTHMDPLLAAAVKAIPEAVGAFVVTETGLSRYTPKTYALVNMHPSEGNDPRWKTFYKQCLPEQNPEKRVRWHIAGNENGDLGPMASVVAPVYGSDKSKFLGITGLHVSMKRIFSNLMGEATEASDTKVNNALILISDENGKVIWGVPKVEKLFGLDQPNDPMDSQTKSLSNSRLEPVRRMTSQLPYMKGKVSDLDIEKTLYWISTYPIQGPDWYLTFLVPKSSLMGIIAKPATVIGSKSSDFRQRLTFIVLLIVLCAAMVLIFVMNRFAKLHAHTKPQIVEMEPSEVIDAGLSDKFDLIEEEDPSSLAQSYDRVVKALQKVNEWEKEQSVELATANQLLQKEIAEREKAEKEIRRLSSRLIDGIEEGRKALAQDLHDEFGQTLAALHMGLESFWKAIPDEQEELKDQIDQLTVLVEQLGDKIRNISSDLRPDLLDDLGLVPTLEWYIHELTNQHEDIEFEFQAVGFRKRLSSEIELLVYRLCQEGLNNIVKHANASHAFVTLTYSHPKVILIVKDDGVGFDQKIATDGIGLLGMRERVNTLNGTITIKSEKGKGTTIRIELPVA